MNIYLSEYSKSDRILLILFIRLILFSKCTENPAQLISARMTRGWHRRQRRRSVTQIDIKWNWKSFLMSFFRPFFLQRIQQRRQKETNKFKLFYFRKSVFYISHQRMHSVDLKIRMIDLNFHNEIAFLKKSTQVPSYTPHILSNDQGSSPIN